MAQKTPTKPTKNADSSATTCTSRGSPSSKQSSPSGREMQSQRSKNNSVSQANKRKPLQHCEGCQWHGKSLRGHLRAKTNCQTFYDTVSLERHAKDLQKQQRAEWESVNRVKRTQRMKNKKLKGTSEPRVTSSNPKTG